MGLDDALAECGVIAILRGIFPDEALRIGDALHAAGIRIAEVPLNSPDPFQSIAILAKRFAGRMLVGAGTVMTEADIGGIVAAGGKLFVTPHADASLTRAAKSAGLYACPGVFTPTEAFSQLAAGADALKLFPAEAAGPAALKAVLAVLPRGTRILPVGGIDAGNIPAWRVAGAAGVGAGSSSYKPGDTPETVFEKASLLVKAFS